MIILDILFHNMQCIWHILLQMLIGPWSCWRTTTQDSPSHRTNSSRQPQNVSSKYSKASSSRLYLVSRFNFQLRDVQMLNCLGTLFGRLRWLDEFSAFGVQSYSRLYSVGLHELPAFLQEGVICHSLFTFLVKLRVKSRKLLILFILNCRPPKLL